MADQHFSISPAGYLLDYSMGTPVLDSNGTPSWKGTLAMPPLPAQTIIPGMAFRAQGLGQFPLEGRVSGKRGSMNILLTTSGFTSPVAASGTINTVAGSALVDTETFTLDDGVNAPVVFEFDSGGGATGVPVPFTGGDTATDIRDAIVTAINGAASLDITASPGGPTQVLLVNDAVGTAGNVVITDTVADAGFTTTGMAGGVDPGPERTVLYLTDNLTTPTKYISVALDSFNRPLVRVTNNLGVLVAEVTPSFTNIPGGQSVAIQMAWNSASALATGRLVTLNVNGLPIPDADWTTNPLAAWTHFQPTYLVAGLGLSASDFTGTLDEVQISNQTS